MPQGFTYIMGSNTGPPPSASQADYLRACCSTRRVRARISHPCTAAIVLYFERFEDIRTAISREKALKGITRARKLALIQTMNPEYRDLAANWGVVHIGPQQSIAQVEEWLQQHPALDPQQQPASPGKSYKPLRQGNHRRDPSLRSG